MPEHNTDDYLIWYTGNDISDCFSLGCVGISLYSDADLDKTWFGNDASFSTGRDNWVNYFVDFGYRRDFVKFLYSP